MYKWKIKFLECDADGSYWNDGWHGITVLATNKEEAIEKALEACNCAHYRDLTIEAEEILPIENKQNISSERALKLIQTLVDKTIEEKGLRKGLEFLFDIGFTGSELIDLKCGADNVIDVQGERREREQAPSGKKVRAIHQSTDSHDGEPYYKCPVCGKTFGYFAAQTGDWKSPDFNCPHCNVEFELD